MDADTIQKKLDCYLLTAKISKRNASSIKEKGKVNCNSELLEGTLATISGIKHVEERLLTRLDYWIYGQLSSEDHQDLAYETARAVDSEAGQTWELNLRPTKKTDHVNSSDFLGLHERQIGRSLSAVKPRSAEPKRAKPWRKGANRKEPESISMFAYNPKTDRDDDTLSTGAMLRKHMAEKFSTFNRRRLKLFFTKENDEENFDAKSRKSVKSQGNLGERSDSNKPKVLLKLMKRSQKQTLPESTGSDVTLRKKTGTRPKSMIELNYNIGDIATENNAQGGHSHRNTSLPDSEGSRKKTLRDRLKGMPIFYIPSSSKRDQSRVFK